MRPLTISVAVSHQQRSFSSKTREKRMRTCSSDSGCDLGSELLETRNLYDITLRLYLDFANFYFYFQLFPSNPRIWEDRFHDIVHQALEKAEKISENARNQQQDDEDINDQWKQDMSFILDTLVSNISNESKVKLNTIGYQLFNKQLFV